MAAELTEYCVISPVHFVIDNTAPHGQAWDMFLLHQLYASVNFNLDNWSDYFPGLPVATLAGVQNLRRISTFIAEILL